MMASFVSGKRYWLIGATEGLGLALARQMHAQGAQLILSGRNSEKLAQLHRSLPGVQVQVVDVASTASVSTAAQAVGEVDGLVYLAGLYWPMAAQALEPAQFEAMCDVNLTGCARVLGAVLPAMVARGQGHLVITGSLAGFRGLPGSMGYGASKAGVMVLAESLYADLRGTGVKVQLWNPGFIRTRLTDKNDFSMPFLMEPDQAASAMLAHMQSPRFKRSFPTLFSLVFRLSQFLPDWAYYPLFARKSGDSAAVRPADPQSR